SVLALASALVFWGALLVRRPHELRPEEIIPLHGECRLSVPWTDPSRADRYRDRLRSDLHRTGSDDMPEGDWLGVYVYTPHYRPVSLAIRLLEHETAADVRDIVQHASPGVPEGLFDSVVPVCPQRYSGYLTMLRFPSHIRGIQDGYAAVMLDLGRVGGTYFATVLPKSLSYAELIGYIGPLTSCDDNDIFLYVGFRTNPLPATAIVTLRDGEVIVAVRERTARVPHIWPNEVLNRPFGAMEHFFPVETHEATCVLYGQQRFTVCQHYHYGQTLVQHVAQFLGLRATRSLMCTFPIDDLDVQGFLCPTVVAVADVPPGVQADPAPERRDIFVLCDLRPLGSKPRFVHTHVRSLHLPSLLSNFEVVMPPHLHVAVLGGVLTGSSIRVTGSCTLLFYPEENTPDDSSGSSSIPDLPPWERADEDLPAAAPLGGGAPMQVDEDGVAAAELESILPDSVLDAPQIDPTLPPGHSWNATSAPGEHVWEPGDELGFEDDDPELAECPQVVGILVVDPPGTTEAPAQALAAAHPNDGAESFVTAFIFTPDFAPEIVRVRLQFPCSANQAVRSVEAARDEGPVWRFSNLHPVSPQPFLEHFLLVAKPCWPCAQVPVLFDCSRVNQTVFCAAVHSPINRESLLLAAGLAIDSDVVVFVHSLLHPVTPGQVISLVPGMLISVAPCPARTPATYDIQERFMSADGWNADADVPGRGAYPGQFFWVLTDAQPFTFEVGPGRRAHFRLDLVSRLQANEARLSIRASKPRIIDFFHRGLLASGVILATETLSRVPYPPARHREERSVVFLDCRPVLLGMRWFLASLPSIDLKDVVDMFQELCPPSFKVSVSGAPTFPFGPDTLLTVYNGIVLTIAFVADVPSDGNSDAPAPDDWPPPTGDEDDDSFQPPDHDLDIEVSNPRRNNDRSRSPRGAPVPSTGGTACAITAADHVNDRSRILRLDPGHFQVVLPPEGLVHAFTSGLTQAGTLGYPDRSAHGLLGASVIHTEVLSALARVCQFNLGPRAARLLAENLVSGSSASDAVLAAREATLRLGEPWPLDAGQNLPAMIMQADSDADSDDDMASMPFLTEEALDVLACPFAVYLFIGLLLVPGAVAVQLPPLAGPAASCTRVYEAAALTAGTVCAGRVTFSDGIPARPLPTPCRASNAVHIDAPHDLRRWDVDGCTVLEQSLRRDDTCFFEASILLEALTDHFQHRRDRTVGRGRTTLALCELVHFPDDAECPQQNSASVPVFALDGRQCLLPCSKADLDELTRPCSFADLQGPPDDVSGWQRFDLWLRDGVVGLTPCAEDVLVLTSDGSYCNRTGQAGWAVSLSVVSASDLCLPGIFIGCYFGSLEDVRTHFPNADASLGPLDAYLAEVCGLLWAAVAALQLPFAGALLFRADNISALDGVAGHAYMKDHPLCTVARNFFIALRSLSDRAVHYQHVLGHAGDASNELADGLAGLGARGRSSTFPFCLSLDTWMAQGGGVSAWLPQLCLSRCRQEEFPQLQHDLLSWHGDTLQVTPGADVMAPFLRALPHADAGTPVSQPTCSVDARLVTYNVLSLLGDVRSAQASGLHGAVGRATLLATTLEARAVHLAGFQECRTPPGTYRCRSFRRFSSGCDANSCFGVELWISEKGPFRTDTVAVLHSEATALIANVLFRDSPICVLVGHAPHRAHPEPVRVGWWDRISQLCRALGGGKPWLFLVDGNCRLGSLPSDVVGDFQADPEDASGEAFHALLADVCSWVPSTFSHTMQGEGGTLCLHRNGEFVRSDYIGVPAHWKSGQVLSWVDPGITTGHVCIDHLASCVVVQLRFASAHRINKAKRIDSAAVAHPDNAAQVRSVIQSAPRVGWEVDVSEHAAALVDHLYSGLVELFPARARGLRESYLSDASRELHKLVGTLRHRVRSRKTALRWTLLRCSLDAWRSGTATFLDLYTGRWLWELRHRLALSCMLLHRAGGALRRQCRVDRAAYFDGVADSIQHSSRGGLHHAVKRVLRPKRFRKASADPLPLLYDKHGAVCESAAAAQDAWREHFSALEDGVTTTPQELADSCRRWHDRFEGTDTIEIQDVPTIHVLEKAFRTTSAQKACGPDLLPPAICHCFSSEMAQAFWPMMLKTVFRASEAVGLKGGLLHHIPKPNPALQHHCAGHRGILVQSCISKAVHRSMRGLATAQWLPHALPVQLGGRKGCSAHFGHFCTRAFLYSVRAQSCSAAVLFVDLAAAYYSVVRETILGPQLGDRSVCSIAASLGLSAPDLQMMQAHIAEHPVLQEQSAAPLFVELARELHSHTWFVLTNDNTLVRTHRGTRPGGALADVVFNLGS
ncbi:unnamed protein product, partial [Symbiodinium sp. CCMP2456]